jgi:hypothetical protein
VAGKVFNMAQAVKFTPLGQEQSNRLKPSKQVRHEPQRKRNDLSDIVIDKEILWIKSAIKQVIRELRDLELEEIKRKYLK